MRNLKKVLSLVLAVAMMVSICVVGAGAVNYDDFKDEGTITKKQAVETLVSLDVLNGYNGGETFAPTQPVTRAEMATIICRVLAGGESLIPDATKEVPTYTDIDGHWAESYIEYCTSLGIVSGKGNGIFDPQANVTAAEAAKMVMTTLGYNADIEGFKGAGWDINTMAKANTLKLTANLVSEISANNAITREQVAQLIYNALSTPVVQYYEGTTANIWIGAGNTNNKYYETLLETKFNAEKVVGVVVANEYADLYDSDPIKKGTTRLAILGTDNEPTGKTQVFSVSTTLDDIGSSVIVYRDKSSNRIIFGNTQDTGMNVYTEFTSYTKDITKGEGAVDKNALTKSTEYFVNFENSYGTYTVKTALKYKVDIASTEYQTLVKGDPVSDELLEDLEVAFDNETLTCSAKYDDFDDWCDNYLKAPSADTAIEKAATANENGNYIKAVDYNNDGEIDFVLKTVYTASTVKKVAKNGDITLTDVIASGTNAIYDTKDNKTTLTSDDELTAGDVVIYTVIDGTAYITLADTVESVKIDKVNKNTVTVTTEDGDEYNQSGVDMVFKVDALDDLGGVTKNSTDNNHAITSMKGKTSYDLFFDLYGNIVAYRTSVTSGDFVLLTDGWYNVAKGGDEYAVKAYLDDEIGTYDVDEGAKDFIISDSTGTLNNSWGNLKTIKERMTTVASYTQNDDGTLDLTPVDEVFNKKNIDVINLDVVELKKNDNKYLIGDAYETSDKADESNTYTEAATYDKDSKIESNEDVKVRPRTDTVYYYVYTNSKGKTVVDTYTGYDNAPSLKADEIKGMYAVGTEYGDYYIANVIVVELKANYRTSAELVFIYDGPEITDKVGKDHFDIIHADGTTENVIINYTSANKLVEGKYEGLYWMYKSGDEYVVNFDTDKVKTSEYADEYITVGYVGEYVDGTTSANYAWIQPQYSNQSDAGTPVMDEIRVKITTGTYYTLNYETNRVDEEVAALDKSDADTVMAEKVGEKDDKDNMVLVVYNKSKEVIYAVSFAVPEKRDDNQTAKNIWERLLPEYVEPAKNAYQEAKDAIAKVPAVIDSDEDLALANDAMTKISTAKAAGDTTNTQKVELETEETKIQALIDAYTGLKNAKETACDAIDAAADGITVDAGYAEADVKAVEAAVAAAKEAINAAADTNAVDSAKTAQLALVEAAVQTAKDNKAAVDSAKADEDAAKVDLATAVAAVKKIDFDYKSSDVAYSDVKAAFEAKLTASATGSKGATVTQVGTITSTNYTAPGSGSMTTVEYSVVVTATLNDASVSETITGSFNVEAE